MGETSGRMNAGTSMKAANIFMALMFLLALAVQYNDPDPIRWMAIYGAAVLACSLAHRALLHWGLPAAVGLIALVWAAAIAPQVIGAVPLGDIFRTFEMISQEVEEAREMGGLLIVVVWMAVLLIVSRRPRA